MARRRHPDAVAEGMKIGGYYDAHSEYQRRVVEGGAEAIRSIVDAGAGGAQRCDENRAEYAADYTAFVRAFSESTMTTHLFEPGARGIDSANLCGQYFSRFENASAADPEVGRYEAWILRLVLVRR